MNIKEELNKLDQNTFNQYDLFNLYSSIKVDKELKEQVVGLIKESKCEELCKLLSEAYEKQTGIPLTEEAYDNLPEIEDKVKGVTDQVTAKAVKDHEKKQKNIRKGLEAADAEIKDEPFTSGENQPKPDKPVVPDLIKEDIDEEKFHVVIQYKHPEKVLGKNGVKLKDVWSSLDWFNCDSKEETCNELKDIYNDDYYKDCRVIVSGHGWSCDGKEFLDYYGGSFDESLKEDTDATVENTIAEVSYKGVLYCVNKNAEEAIDNYYEKDNYDRPVLASIVWENKPENVPEKLSPLNPYVKNIDRIEVIGFDDFGYTGTVQQLVEQMVNRLKSLYKVPVYSVIDDSFFDESLKEDKVSAEDAKPMGYEEAKEYCKSKGINLDRKTYNMILRIAGKKEPENESLKESETVDTGHYALWDEEPYTKEQLLYELNSDKMLEKSKGSFQVGHPDERDICAEILSDAGYEYEISGDGPWFHFEYWKEEINEDFPYIPGDEDATIILSNIEWDLDGEDKQPDLPKGLEIDFHEVYEDGNDYLFDDEFDKLQKYLEEIYGFAIKDFYIEIKKK